MKILSNKILFLSLLVVMVFGLTSCSSNNDNDAEKQEPITIFTWDGMFPKDVIQGFEDETGIKVNFANFDLDETMLAKLEEAKGGSYDVVIADDYILESVIEKGLAQKLDKSKISTFDNINPLYQGHFYDPKDEYTVPYGAGIPLIVYNPALTDVDIKGYNDLWDKSLKDNVAIVGNYRVINGITLNAIGETLNCEDKVALEKAGKKLTELAPNIRVISDSNTQDFLISDEVAAAFLYTSQVFKAIQARPDLKMVYPEEGLGFGIMPAFIPKNAPNSDGAHKFLEYINKPEVAAKCFEHLGYYTTNKASEEFINPDLKRLLVAPSGITKGEVIHNISTEANDMQMENWNKFQSSTK